MTATQTSRAIGLCVLANLAMHSHIVKLLPIAGGTPDLVTSTVVTLFVGLSVAAGVGMLMVRRWGFLALFALVAVSTAFFGMSIVPLATALVPPPMNMWVMIATNIIVAAISAWVFAEIDRGVEVAAGLRGRAADAW